MSCFEIQEKIIDLVIGDLAPEDETLIREHIKTCPMCRDELEFLSGCLQTCILEETETCECHFQETYWEEFVVSTHEKISHEKIESKFPFHIVIPVAASTLLAMVLGWYFFLRPPPKKTVQEENPSYYEYDPYQEVDDLSPEETEEFLKMIDQKYGE